MSEEYVLKYTESGGIRCSLQVGEVIWRNDDITGIAVNIAARALEKCHSNTVMITKNLKDLLGRTKFSVTSMGDYCLKGLSNALTAGLGEDTCDTILLAYFSITAEDKTTHDFGTCRIKMV